MELICSLISVYYIVLFARILLSWFPLQPGTALASVASIVYQLTEPVMGPVRRLIDFSSGLAYALGGSMSRVADQVFLLTPSNVEVSQEEKERLQARGLFRA